MVRVAAPAGTGLDELRASLARLVADAASPDLGMPRLPVDRAFVMPGFGTVVTGTLVDGTLRVGDELELLPSWPAGARPVRGRARGLQQHGVAVNVALPGSRTSVNLQGVDRDPVDRAPSARVWAVRQIVEDPETHRDFAIVATVDLAASDAAGEPVIRTMSFGSAHLAS